MPQVSLVTSSRKQSRDEVSELERMIVSAGHVATGLGDELEHAEGPIAERTRKELQSIWDILVAAEMTLLKVQAKYPRMAEAEH